MKDKYVLDSNIWIEIERKNPKVLDRVDPLIQGNRVCLIDIIIAEVLRGTRTRKDFRTLKSVFDDFPVLTASWKDVSDLAFLVARKGFYPPLIDLYIAQAVSKNKKILITRDSDFTQIAKVKPFSLEIL